MYQTGSLIPRDIMVDLETLGSAPGCIVLSIGAVAFDPRSGALGAAFHTVVSSPSCRKWELTEDPATLDWWGRQKPEARQVIADAAVSPTSLTQALKAFEDFLREHGGANQVRVWGNGSDFDNAILADLYRRTGRRLPWAFWNSRCFRTLKGLIAVAEPERAGVHHNALDDARHQAVWALRIFAALGAPAPAPAQPLPSEAS
jgi:hypothetical protein